MSATYASVADAHKALGELDLAGLPAPLTISIYHDSNDYARFKAVIHVHERAFDQWFTSIGAEDFDVRHREDEYLEMFAAARNGVEVFCLVEKTNLEAQA